ncbi:hypothetical protein HDU88_008848 [Geranomyces variabilis]|nr:hypothetical protein HDU88_008848 [Geranomyces variabilis]
MLAGMPNGPTPPPVVDLLEDEKRVSPASLAKKRTSSCSNRSSSPDSSSPGWGIADSKDYDAGEKPVDQSAPSPKHGLRLALSKLRPGSATVQRSASSPNTRSTTDLGFSPSRSPSKHSEMSRSPSVSSDSPSRRTSSNFGEPVRETNVMVRDYDPHTGNKIINKYMIVREVGRGCHGKVKLCTDLETGEEWALKIVPKKARPRFQSRLHSNRVGLAGGPQGNPDLEKIMREIAILKKCDHPHVVGLREVIDDPGSEKIYLEYLAGGDIKWQNTQNPKQPLVTEQDARRIFRDVVCGIDYLHYQGIVHRDIKPANLLWTSEGRVKISDFGVSVVVRPRTQIDLMADQQADQPERIHELELAKTAGTPAFFAPEMCGTPDEDFSSSLASLPAPGGGGGSDDPPIGKGIDIWALGVTLYCLVFGAVPFIAETEYELFSVISRKPLEFPPDVAIDPALQDLLTRLLDKDPATRITLEEIKVHPWTTADLTAEQHDQWLREADPSYQYGAPVEVTEDDVRGAVTMLSKLRARIRKLSSSFQNLTAGFRNRTRSASNMTASASSSSATSATPTSAMSLFAGGGLHSHALRSSPSVSSAEDFAPSNDSSDVEYDPIEAERERYRAFRLSCPPPSRDAFPAMPAVPPSTASQI